MTATILVVEDEPAIQELISCNLELAGHRALRADTAEQALDMLRAELPDLVVLDWMLPGMSGIDFARRMRAERRTQDIPVIMLTARADENDKLLGLETGADDYLTKPFSPRELNARVKAVLRRRAPQATDDAVEAARPSPRAGEPARHGARRGGVARSHRIPSAAFLHDASRARVQPRAAARPGVGRSCLRRRAHGGRAHPAAAQSAGSERP